jgi:fructose-specific phosphotransferase system IIA component
MHLTELVSYFREEFFLPDIQARDKEALLDEIVEPLLQAEVIKNKRVILETLKKRETLGSTGIGYGVAIPHCRTLSVSDIQIVVGVSKNGVNYEALDGEPVHLFFLIVAPPQEKSNQYLPILGKLVELLRDEAFRARLKSIPTFDEFKNIMLGE